jgi:uncharacterized protein with von Willebrand factor type A (vWA) domain
MVGQADTAMSDFEYAKWDGSQSFESLSAGELFDNLSDYLLEHGEFILRRLEQDLPDDADILERLIRAGYLERDENGILIVSSRGARRMQEQALSDLFQIQKKDRLGKHESEFRGAGQVRHDEGRPYQFGDPVSNLDLHETLRNTMYRQGGGSPLHVAEEDFVVHETEYQTSCATVLLVDMSGSMARYGKFLQAKRVALALHALIRGRFPEDSLKTIGFYTYASPLSERELLRAGPKPVSIFDHRVFMRVNLDDPPKFVPEHFTNIQAGLQFARRSLMREPARNRQIICITDGEPTAHIEGRELVLIYPPSERTARATLEEVQRCHDSGIRVSTLALIEDYFYLDLKNFVDEMARLSRGVAVYCTAGELGKYVFDSFVNGRRARRQVG